MTVDVLVSLDCQPSFRHDIKKDSEHTGTICITGIGRAICKALHASGAQVYGVSKTAANLDSLKVNRYKKNINLIIFLD